jgi:filamentous hemagglutinin
MSSITRSAISDGMIRIGHRDSPKRLSDEDVAKLVSTVNRDTNNLLNGVAPIFDRERVEAGFEIAVEASRQVSQFFAYRATGKRVLERTLTKELDKGSQANGNYVTFLIDQINKEQQWSASGKYGQILLVLTGAASANVTPETRTFLQSAAIRYLHNQGIDGIAKFMDGLGYTLAQKGCVQSCNLLWVVLIQTGIAKIVRRAPSVGAS